MPTLVIAGESDLITPPKNQDIFAQLIPYSEICVVPEGSHCSQMEKPELVNSVIRNFLGSVEREESVRKKTKSKKIKKSGKRALALN